MSITRLVQHSIRSMTRYKLRTGFMGLGTLVGVTALTLVISVGQAFESKILTMFSRMFGDSAIMISDGGGRMMGGPHGPGIRLKIDDTLAMALITGLGFGAYPARRASLLPPIQALRVE